MGMTGLLAAGAFTATTQIGAGETAAKSIKSQSQYNAAIYDQQAEVLKEQKKISDAQYIRQSARARGTIIARTAGKGLNIGGSPLAVLIDNESQMLFDKAIGDYNYQINQNYAKSSAENTRITGRNESRLASYTGYTNAFSTTLNTFVGAKYWEAGRA